MSQLPPRLIKAIRDKRWTPFVGAGFSKLAAPNLFPTWRELVDLMLDEFPKRALMNADNADALRRLYDQLGPAMLADSIKKVVTEAEFYAFLQSYYASDCGPSAAHDVLVTLAPRCIVTTNYDRLIETSYARSRHQILPKVTYKEPGQVRKHLQDGSEFIFKIHGDIDRPGDMVLTHSDYVRLQATEDGYQLVLSSIFIHTTVVFIGLSLTDPEINDHLRRLRSALKREGLSHFALLPSESTDNERERELAEDFGIKVITFQKSHPEYGLHALLTKIKNATEHSHEH